jgi:hypothetical protein
MNEQMSAGTGGIYGRTGRDPSMDAIRQKTQLRVEPADAMAVSDVRLCKAMLVLVTLAFWLVGSNHCRIEQLPGMQFLACAPADCATDPHDESSDCAGHENPDCADDACADDSCAVVEGAVYQAGILRVKAEVPTLISSGPALALRAVLPDIEVPIRQLCPPQCDSPSGLPQLWQFAQRAAAPPRAPSFQA